VIQVQVSECVGFNVPLDKY